MISLDRPSFEDRSKIHANFYNGFICGNIIVISGLRYSAGRFCGLNLTFIRLMIPGSGLIRAFQDENTTVLQFANLEGESFVILMAKGIK